MWTPCPTVLDMPATICGLEVEDFVLAALTPVLVGWFNESTLVNFGGGLGLGVGLHRIKRGRPAGVLLHWLHRQQLCVLPGILSPQRVRYSPG